MELFIFFLLLIVPYLIAQETGRAGLAVLITTLGFILIFTILNARGGHLTEALGYAFGLSMFVAVFSAIGAKIGSGLHSESKKIIINPEKTEDTEH